MASERAYWLAWSQIPGIGPVLLKRIHQRFGSLADAWRASEPALAEVEGLGVRSVAAIAAARSRLDPAALLEQHSQKDSRFWTPDDPDYPRPLLDIPSPPPVLYYRGRADLREMGRSVPAAAIVGTRYPTEHGRRWTRRISAALAERGFTVVSGMAAGIDGEAHRSCLAAGGQTLAVLGTGIDVIYPPSHRQLYQQIQERGTVLSEYPPGTPPDRGNFPPRNRIIVGLCRSVLVMEAPEKSGALITARYGKEFQRDIYTLPNSPEVPEARGCLKLIHRGAEIIVTEGELLARLGAGPAEPPPRKASLAPDLAPDLARVYQAIAAVPTPLDPIVQETGLSAGEVSGALLQLELLGLVAQLPGMRYERR